MPSGVYKRTEEQKEFCRRIGKLGGKKRILKDKKCLSCNKLFRPCNSFIKFCSYKCFTGNRPKKGEYKKCQICGKKFYVTPSRIKIKIYCSNKCKYKSQEIPESKTKLICKWCGKEYIVRKVQIKYRGSSFCSKTCMKKFRERKYYKSKKKKSTTLAKMKKLTWKVFSEYIRQRDDGTCISCGKKDFWRKMDAGHYIPRTAGLSLYFDERNVNCQCTYCNRWMHGNLAKYAIALRKKYGETILEELDEKRKEFKRYNMIEYQQMIEKYKIKVLEVSKKD